MTTVHVPPEQMAMRRGWGWSVLADTATAQSPGTLQWGGVYGYNWFLDRKGGISSVLLTNTALEGMIWPLTAEVRDAVVWGGNPPIRVAQSHFARCQCAYQHPTRYCFPSLDMEPLEKGFIS